MPTALILGAASDMAMAIAEKFASKGFDIQLAARNVSRLEALQSDLAIKYTSRVSTHEFDALAYDTHQSFFFRTRAEARCGHLCIWIIR